MLLLTPIKVDLIQGTSDKLGDTNAVLKREPPQPLMLLRAGIVSALFQPAPHNETLVALELQLCVAIHHGVILRDEPKP